MSRSVHVCTPLHRMDCRVGGRAGLDLNLSFARQALNSAFWQGNVLTIGCLQCTTLPASILKLMVVSFRWWSPGWMCRTWKRHSRCCSWEKGWRPWLACSTWQWSSQTNGLPTRRAYCCVSLEELRSVAFAWHGLRLARPSLGTAFAWHGLYFFACRQLPCTS